jgi:hypothetical protein
MQEKCLKHDKISSEVSYTACHIFFSNFEHIESGHDNMTSKNNIRNI